MKFDAPPGRVRLHMSAETEKNVRVDADDRNVEVPDYTVPGPVITEPIVFRGRTARDIQLLRAATAPIPTAARTFSRTERILVRFQAFGPTGQTPVVTMRLLNAQGDNMAALPAPTATPSGYRSRPRSRAAAGRRLLDRDQRAGRHRTGAEAAGDPGHGLRQVA